MKDIISRGHLMAIVTYVFCGLAFLISIPFRHAETAYSAIGISAYLVLSVCLLLVMNAKKHVSQRSFEVITTLFYGIFAIAVQLFWKGRFIIFLIFMLLWMVSIGFLDVRYFTVLAVTEAACIGLLTLLPTELTGMQRYEAKDIVVSVSALLISVWIGRNLVHTLIDINEENQEQERSLDDMLEIVEAKHQEAKNATKSKSAFLSNMSHEIRTPINTILGMNEMILRESENPAVFNYATNIKNSGVLLLSLINDILDTSKIESGKMELVEAEFDIAGLIGDICNMVSGKMKEKNLQFNVIVDPTIPSGYIGDDVKLRQVLINLLTNAIKYTIAGSVTLRVSGETEDDMAFLHFSVADTGIGIREEDRKKLSEAFVRFDQKKNRKIEGTGLGISIVCSYLGMMGSTLKVESKFGQESTFSFDLDLAITDHTPIGDFSEKTKSEPVQEDYTSSFTAPDAEVLVVDDNGMNLIVFTSLLKQTQVKIDTAISGKIALEMTSKKKYDIIFMDHMMPGMDGVECFHLIRNDPDNLCKDVPCVALTANAVTGAREMYREEGFDGFLAKPVIPEKLESMIRDMLPEEMINPGTTAERGKYEGGSNYVPEFDDLPKIEGLDYNYGWMHLHDQDLLIRTLRDMSKTMKTDAAFIEDCLTDIKAGADTSLDAFRIKVHAMKSAANLVGLVPLGGSAALLEYAARAGRIDRIMECTPYFVEEWKEYSNRLREAFADEAGYLKPVTDVTQVVDLLNVFRDAVEEFDVANADQAIEELKNYDFEPLIREKIELAEAAALDFDAALVSKLSDEISELLLMGM